MILKNAKGEVTLTPSSQAKEDARQKLAELKGKKPTTIKELTERIEAIEKVLGI
jgi:hypothetical protein